MEIGVLVFSGLADITCRRLAGIAPGKPAVCAVRDYELVSLRCNRDQAMRVVQVRTAEDVFLKLAGPCRAGPVRDFAREVGRLIRQEDILGGIQLRNALFNPCRPKRVSFECFVKQDRDYEIRRKAVADAVCRRVGDIFPRWRRADPASIELWGFIIKGEVHLFFRLSDNGLRSRNAAPALRPGVLRPTIAAAMVQVAGIQAGETVLDPMCGTGTIIVEAVAICPSARYSAGDVAEDAVQSARERLGRWNGVSVSRWDARSLPLPESSIDCIVCNLPFGRQYSSSAENPRLYRAIIEEWKKKLAPAGRMVLLTSDVSPLEQALALGAMHWERLAEVNVLGRRAYILSVRTIS